MSEIDDGGTAFPCHTNPMPGKLANAPQGMTLRDYFAAAALQGFLANPGNEFVKFYEIASDAYKMSDAMIAARKEAQP